LAYDPTPLVLVHGLWDTPQVFSPLLDALGDQRPHLLVPHLPHRLGRRPIKALADDLDRFIGDHLGDSAPLDLLGFSMGGLIGRTWLQQQKGAARTRRFLSVASPQQGTVTAQAIPRSLFAGLADMKRGSALVRELEAGLPSLEPVECRSYCCPWDLMVVPGWRAVLPIGSRRSLAVSMHHRMICSPKALEQLVAALAEPPSPPTLSSVGISV